MKKDIFINLIITIGISVTLFLVNKYFALYLGAQNLGLMKLFSQMLAYLNLAEMGLASASAYAFYKPLADKNYEKISIVLNTVKSLYNKIFVFIMIVGLALNPVIPFFIKDHMDDKTLYLYWTLYVISTALSYTFVKYSVLFTADQKFSFVRVVEGGSRICCQLLQIFVIVKFRSFLFFIILLILNNLIQYIFYRIHYQKYYKYIVKTKKRDSSITTNLKNLFWHKVAGLIVFNTDLILISKFISLEIVGIYASYQMVIQMIITVLNIVFNVLKPRVGKFIAENSKEEIFNFWKKLNLLFLGIAIIFVISTYKLINPFIGLWLGTAFILPKETVILMLINLFIQSFRGITDIFKDGSGFFDDIHLPIAEAVINFVVSIILVHYIGLNGIIIGTICSNVSIICIAKPILVFERCFDKKLKDYIKVYSGYLFKVILSLILVILITKFIKINIVSSWINWILNGMIMLVISTISVVVVFLGDKDFRKILNDINTKFTCKSE